MCRNATCLEKTTELSLEGNLHLIQYLLQQLIGIRDRMDMDEIVSVEREVSESV